MRREGLKQPEGARVGTQTRDERRGREGLTGRERKYVDERRDDKKGGGGGGRGSASEGQGY